MKNVEYHRDIKPIFARSCNACHAKGAEKPAGELVLDDDTPVKTSQPAGLSFEITVPTSYARLAADAKGQWGHKPLHRHGWHDLAASRYVRLMQSRRSLLVWKIFGERLDGWKNDDMPFETTPGDPKSLRHHGEPVADSNKNRELSHIGYTGSVMPPPEAVKSGKVKPLSEEDRLTIVRWIDLGCPIDLDFDPANPEKREQGWLADDQRPTLVVTYPQAGANHPIEKLLIGMHDYATGIDAASFTVKADIEIDGIAAGENLASKFREVSPGIWEWNLAKHLANLSAANLTVSVKDKQGNETRIERAFSVK